MKQSIALPEDVLQSLGWIAWSAMNLEDWSRRVCDLVLGSFDTKHHIGDYINRAVQELESWANPALTAFVSSWLIEAKASMDRRNQILHAVPVTIVDVPRSGVPDRPAIVYFPRQGRDGKRDPSVQTMLDTKSLNLVAEQIGVALDGYVHAHSVASSNRRWRDAEKICTSIVRG